MENHKSVWAVSAALLVITVGLMLLCAQQQSTVDPGEDLSLEDEQFRSELMDLLDLAEDTDGGSQRTDLSSNQDTSLAVFGEFDEMSDSGRDDDVLALLVPDNTESMPDQNLDSTPLSTIEPENSGTGINRDTYSQIKNDVDRLEALLNNKSHVADSLRRIIQTRSARIRELESSTTTSRTTRMAGAPARSGVSSGFLAKYQTARSKFESYDYAGAVDAFQQLLENYPDHPMADNCQYWCGESYYGLKQYDKAIIEFQKVFGYAQNDKHDDAQLMIAQSYVRLGQKDRARAEFQNFLNNFNNSEYVGVAQRYYQNI
ncbi:tetratricopeptide repeat protein [candidate division KSB1 bacterium]|nr:tetratricopeptide repeat protein [candidate division KSB1 bacterium]